MLPAGAGRIEASLRATTVAPSVQDPDLPCFLNPLSLRTRTSDSRGVETTSDPVRSWESGDGWLENRAQMVGYARS